MFSRLFKQNKQKFHQMVNSSFRFISLLLNELILLSLHISHIDRKHLEYLLMHSPTWNFLKDKSLAFKK